MARPGDESGGAAAAVLADLLLAQGQRRIPGQRPLAGRRDRRTGRRHRDDVRPQARAGSRAGVLTVASNRTTAAAAQAEPNQNGAGGAIRLHSKPAITEAGRIINPWVALRMPNAVARSSVGARSATLALPTPSLKA